MTEDKMVGWYHRFNGPEFEQTQAYPIIIQAHRIYFHHLSNPFSKM